MCFIGAEEDLVHVLGTVMSSCDARALACTWQVPWRLCKALWLVLLASEAAASWLMACAQHRRCSRAMH